RHELRARVPADVVKGAHLPVIPAHEDHGLRPDVDLAVIARRGHLCLDPGENPMAAGDEGEGEVEYLTRGVEGRLERMTRPARLDEAADIERGSHEHGGGL